jgi:hypothetical protein
VDWNKAFKEFCAPDPPEGRTIGGAVASEAGLIEVEVTATV